MQRGSLCRVIVLYCFIICAGCKYGNRHEPVIHHDQIEQAQTQVEVDTNDYTHGLKQGWIELTELDDVVLDIRYATDNNFTKKQIYPCPACYLRQDLAGVVLDIHKEVNEKYGYSVKLFDCYRPSPAQQKLWDIVPDARYVTPPSKGSMHNKGLAVDITLVDENGRELDMGTTYDFFGPEAHIDNRNHSEEVLMNRDLLKSLFESRGCQGIRTEWWHFSLEASYPLSDWVWNCK